MLLLLSAVIIFLCVLINRLTARIGVPMLFLFILLGMVFGSDGLVKIPFEDYAAADQICSVALIVIIFYGGFGTRWSEARPVALKATLLSTVGVFLTAGFTALFCRLAMRMDWLASLLIGAVISSTDAASVFSIMRGKRLGMKYNTASLLELESGSNDPSAYMLTAVVLSVMAGKGTVGSVLYMVFAQYAYGILLGVVVALCALVMLRRFRFASPGFDMAFLLGCALLAYALPTLVGGNGYLSVYLVGIILGNSRIAGKQALVHFFDGLTGLMQMLIFFLLGLLATPSLMLPVLLPSALIALFLTFAARPAAVFLVMSPFGCRVRQQLMVSFAGLRGAASIVFAIMVTVSPAYLKTDVFHLVFGIVLFSILFQGSLIPRVAKLLKMQDDAANVLKTFTDYTDEVGLQFIRLAITPDHPWRDQPLHTLCLPPDTLVVMVRRGLETIIPGGETVLRVGDEAVLSAAGFCEDPALSLREQRIDEGSEWVGKPISDFSPSPGELVMMILRGKQTIVPRGDTALCAGDVLVMNAGQPPRKAAPRHSHRSPRMPGKKRNPPAP